MNLIGASVWSGIQNTWELNAMNYNRAMKSDDKNSGKKKTKKNMKGW